MAGDDEELSMLLSTISDPVGANVDLNQILYMNGIHGEHQYQTLDQVSQILNIPSLPTNTEFYSREEFQKQRSVSVSISSPESGIGSEYNDTAAISPGTAVDFTNQPVSSGIILYPRWDFVFCIQRYSTKYVHILLTQLFVKFAQKLKFRFSLKPRDRHFDPILLVTKNFELFSVLKSLKVYWQALWELMFSGLFK